MTILAGNLISNSMQDAIKLGNVRKLERESKELQVEKQVEKQVQPTMNDFSFIKRYKIKKIAEDKLFSAIFSFKVEVNQSYLLQIILLSYASYNQRLDQM